VLLTQTPVEFSKEAETQGTPAGAQQSEPGGHNPAPVAPTAAVNP